MGYFSMFAVVADGQIAGYGIEPGGKTGFRAVLVDPLPGIDECLLRQVFSVLAPGSFLTKEIEQPGFMALDQFFKRIQGTPLALSGQLLIGFVREISHRLFLLWRFF
jgi:hypothetical protein